MLESFSWTIIFLVALTALALVLLVVLVWYCCIRRGPCGPQGISAADQLSIVTFVEFYRVSNIDIPADLFELKSVTWRRFRPVVYAVHPVDQWSDLLGGSAKGFLVQPAKDINYTLQAFQHRVWAAHGDQTVHWPVMLVAQEWRLWAMQKLQLAESPSLETKEDVASRIDWLAESRNLQKAHVSELRRASCWDESDNLSLLLVFRDHVRPILQTVLDTWVSFELQQTFSMKLHNLKTLLYMTVRNALRFIEVVLRRNDLRVHSKLWTMQERVVWPSESLDMLVEHVQALFDLASSTADSAKTTVADKPSNPWMHVTAAGDELSETEQALYDEFLSSHNGAAYGLAQPEYEILTRRYVLLHRWIILVAEASVMVRRLARFAQIGGELFIAASLGKEHVIELLSFAEDAVATLRVHLLEVGEQAQAGWETLRRSNYTSVWSSPGPMDNLRLALAACSDSVASMDEAVNLTAELKGRAERSTCQMLLEEMNQEMESYLNEWAALKTKHGLQSGVRLEAKKTLALSSEARLSCSWGVLDSSAVNVNET